MKKYLMIGIAAIALCAAFTSCSRDFEAPTEEELAQIEAQKAFAKYENAFTTAFGQPAADQDWGFGSLPSEAEARGITRSVDYVLLDQDPTQPTAPTQPEFRDKTAITKPTMPTDYYTTQADVKAHVTYAKNKDWDSWEDSGAVVYVDANYATVNDKKDQTIYIVGNVTYQSSMQTGIVFVVTENSKLTLRSLGQHMSVYLASNATLDVNKTPGNEWDYITFDGTSALYMNSGSQVIGSNLKFYNGCKVLNDGATITATNLQVDKNTTLWNEGTITVTNNLVGANENAFIYNAAGKTISANNLSMINNSNLLYNDGTLSVSGNIYTTNSESEIVNNASLTAASFDSSAGGKFLNDESGTVTISGTTYLTNLNSLWQNKGVYTSGDFEIENTRKVYNNCKLTVTATGTSGTGTFHFIKNSAFVLDGQASVKTDKMIWDDDCDFYMKDNSLLWVVGRLLAKNDDKGYGAHGLGTGYSVIKANSIEYESGKQSRMNYWGKIFVDTDSHFPQGFDDPSNQYTGASQPHYYYSTKNKTVMFKFLGDACPVSSIASGKCHHGYTPPTPPTPPVNLTSLRVMAEDLSASQASDFDFNDVVFDVEYVDDGHAKITLRAAGGTLPLKINSTNGEGGWEVHEMFDVPVNTMVNTNAQKKNLTYADKPAVVLAERFEGDFTKANFAQTVKNIRVEVYKSKTWMLLEANQGVACCKFGCSLDKNWVDERRNIDNFYNFSDWVQGFTTTLTKKGNW